LINHIDFAMLMVVCESSSMSVFTEYRDLLTAFIGAIAGGIFTFGGVVFSMKHNQRLNYSRFYLQFHRTQIHIERFLYKTDILSAKLSRDRNDIQIAFNKFDFIELREDIESTIISLNKEIKEVDLDNFVNVLGDINENAPLEYYFDLNFILFAMVNIYNGIREDSKYLVKELPNSIGSIRTSMPHQKQLKLLKKRLKKIRKKMAI